VAAVISATNGFLHDSRAQIGGGRLLYELGVPIVLLTAIPEEFRHGLVTAMGGPTVPIVMRWGLH
jgi:hypothetical protein